jgi:hypothetical protein
MFLVALFLSLSLSFTPSLAAEEAQGHWVNGAVRGVTFNVLLKITVDWSFPSSTSKGKGGGDDDDDDDEDKESTPGPVPWLDRRWFAF